jgi:hypothetical protein
MLRVRDGFIRRSSFAEATRQPPRPEAANRECLSSRAASRDLALVAAGRDYELTSVGSPRRGPRDM